MHPDSKDLKWGKLFILGSIQRGPGEAWKGQWGLSADGRKDAPSFRAGRVGQAHSQLRR